MTKDTQAKAPTGFEQADAGPTKASDIPAAGPHAEPDLVDPEKTPGAGALPEEEPTGEADAGVG